jgi:hypothetical protein
VNNGWRPPVLHRARAIGALSIRLLPGLMVALVALLTVTAPFASAKQIHKFSYAFGTPTSNTTLSLAGNSGLAVNETSHDIYVADTGNRRIVQFSAAGAFIRAFGADVGGPGINVCTIGCQAGTAGTSPGSFESPTFLAIDNSGGASDGAVYVADSATNVISKFEADGTLTSSWGNNGASEAANGQLAGKTQAEPFGELAGIAVDSAGTLAVFETSSRLLKFAESGGFIEEVLEAERGSSNRGLSVDGEGNFFKVNGVGSTQKFAPSGASIGQITADVNSIGLAVNPATGVLYVDGGAAISGYGFNGAGEVIHPAGSCTPQIFVGCPASERFGEGALTEGGALAVDGSSDTVYAADVGTSSIAVFTVVTLPDVTTNLAEVHSTTTATLNGEVDPNEVPLEECFFEYGETTEYGAIASCEDPDAEEVGAGSSPVPVHADLTKLTPGATYHYRLVAGNSNGINRESGDQEFFTGPTIVSTFVSDVSATAATLNTEINPHGAATTYRFQYVSNAAFQGSGYATASEIPLGGEGIGSGSSPVLLARQLIGLTPASTYHYRVLADSGLGTVTGPDGTFTTQITGLGFQLADSRAWEMVSPPDKHGGRLDVLSYGFEGRTWHIQASADGNGLAYHSYLSTEANPDGNRFLEPSMNLARRDPDGSWHSKDITTPNEKVSPALVGNGGEYKIFSPDLTKALLEPRGHTPLSPKASERGPYLRENTEPPTYTPLVTGKEPYANVPPGTEFGGGRAISVRVQAVAHDFEHVALKSSVPLVEGAPANAIYQWSGGQILPLGVLPPDEGGIIATGANVGSHFASIRNALSWDGSRAFWTNGTKTALYLRYNSSKPPSAIAAGECTEPEKACTVRIDVEQPGASGAGEARPIFQGASTVGNVVFFTDSRQLTVDATPGDSNLYRCEIAISSTPAGCASLKNLSVASKAGEMADVKDLAAAISDDGTAIYFVADGVLDTSPNSFGDIAVSGQPNLYLWEEGKGARFIATLDAEDRTDWGQAGASSPAVEETSLSAAGSPNGRYLAFMSQASLTGYDNRDESTGDAAQEVFRYDAVTDELECISCNPTGSRPQAHHFVGEQTRVNPGALWGGQPVAAALSLAISTGKGAEEAKDVSLYRPRTVLDNGRVFFNAIDSLAPADSNGQWDIYQYESTGVGDCGSAWNGASVSSAGGCVSLLSSGTAEDEAAFLDASESGDDVFFFTTAQLNETDTDHELDAYDARVNGIPARLPKVAECLGEACQPASQGPNDPTPASSAFNGSGNVKNARRRCPKGQRPVPRKGKRQVRRKGKLRCVPRKRKHDKRNGGKSRRGHR